MPTEGPLDEFVDVCAHCGQPFSPGVDYPVHTERDHEGELHLYAFCDGTCNEQWLADRDRGGSTESPDEAR